MAASRETAAANEFAIAPPADDQIFAAFRTGAANFFQFGFGDRDFGAGTLQGGFKIAVELANHIGPFTVAGGNIIQIGLHIGGKMHIHNVG